MNRPLPAAADTQLRNQRGLQTRRWLLYWLPLIIDAVAVLYVIFGPHKPWQDYLLFGAVWGLSWPLRHVVRQTLQSVLPRSLNQPSSIRGWRAILQDVLYSERDRWAENGYGRFTVMMIACAFWPASIPLYMYMERNEVVSV